MPKPFQEHTVTRASMKKTLVLPLRANTQKKGAPGGTESKKEILPLMQKHLHADSVVAGSDSGLGLQKAWQDMEVPSALARHNLDEMTPTRSWTMSKLKPAQQRTVKHAAVAKRPAALLSPKETRVRVVGGDNQCESHIAHGKNQLRRVNALGRMAPSSAHVTLLACRRLLHSPGLATVLDSLASYRRARVGCLGCDPRHYADYEQDKQWLFQ